MLRSLALLPWDLLGLALALLPDPYAEIPDYVLNPFLLLGDHSEPLAA